jgi:hypothetical protein
MEPIVSPMAAIDRKTGMPSVLGARPARANFHPK